jgi:phosphatidylinositol 4-kinase
MVLASNPDSTPDAWTIRGGAIAAISAVCLIHAFTPRLGIWLSNGLGAFKLVLLTLVVITGFAALAGRLKVDPPGNFSSFKGGDPSQALDVEDKRDGAPAAAGFALALLQVLYAYSGWENANYVLTEVRDAPRTLRKAAPLAIAVVTVLYVLANIAYVSYGRCCWARVSDI